MSSAREISAEPVVRACPACGDSANSSDDAYCVACGAAFPAGSMATPSQEKGTDEDVHPTGDGANVHLAPPANHPLARCHTCGGTSPAESSFCVWCGNSFGPPPPFRLSAGVKRVIKTGVAAAGLAVLAVSALVVYALLQPAKARLIVWTDGGNCELALDDGRTLRVFDERDLRLPAGEYTLHAWSRPSEDRGETVRESVTLPLEAGRVHLVHVGGRPVSVSVRASGRQYENRVIAPCGEPLWLRATEGKSGDTIHAGNDILASGEWLSAWAELSHVPSDSALTAQDGDCLLIANPYDEPIWCETKLGAIRLSFLLPGCSVRCLPRAAHGPLTFKASVAGEQEPLDEQRFEPPAGISLYTIGQATCYAWRREGSSDEPHPPPFFPPKFQPVLPDGSGRIDLSASYERGEPGRPLLSRTSASGERESLLVLASAPLVSPQPQPLAQVTTHPEVRVRELPIAGSLRGQPLDSVSVQGDSVVGLIDGEPRDLGSGAKLCQPGPSLVSAAVSSSGLVGVTRQARLAHQERERLVLDSNVSDPTLLAWSCPGLAEVFLFGGQASGGLYVVAGQKWRLVLDGTHHVTALGTIGGGLLVARGRVVERLTLESGTPKLAPILELPPGPPVLGLHDAHGLLVFATEDTCYMVSGGVVLPLAVGIGGPLFPYRDGLLVHDSRSRKVLLLESPFFSARQVADAGAKP